MSADVLVVGGGPAGTAAAIWAAHCGLRVVLLERTRFPRHRPGETLHPGVEPIFRQLGVAQDVATATEVRHAGHQVRWAGHQETVQFGADAGGPWLGYQVLRERLDAILLTRARQIGVTVMEPHAAAGRPLMREGRVCGLSSPMTLPARFVVDASGAHGFMRRNLGLDEVTLSPPLRAYYGYGTGDIDVGDILPSLAGDQGGWIWTARIGRRTFNWTRLDFRADTRSSKLAPNLRGVQWQSPVRGADVTWRLVPASAGPGYFIAGDAAAVLDPASSHGVLRALMSGMMAAHVIAKVMSGAVREPDGLQHYRTWHASWFEHDVKRLRESYRALNPALPWTAAAPPASRNHIGRRAHISARRSAGADSALRASCGRHADDPKSTLVAGE